MFETCTNSYSAYLSLDSKKMWGAVRVRMYSLRVCIFLEIFTSHTHPTRTYQKLCYLFWLIVFVSLLAHLLHCNNLIAIPYHMKDLFALGSAVAMCALLLLLCSLFEATNHEFSLHLLSSSVVKYYYFPEAFSISRDTNFMQ
ncbi:hypothetical protein BDN70DRAFT_886470 [Pholiota conissans]|uniref:Uncharacterized protein n=1 Tax=Pholiota conissans TaxID=109636 RepID=A0A9P5YRY6_9AGAR|nr:hypothetical protein BDN70DRAFT_886470 [Pholiota conissans]